ncbi:hypothetical protein AAFF_G00353290 [Aldrovandia affinis]|uniref:Uncharacterized protein n=1 Tax=Aldrovandia affinis TaxID=143900 RepID=A0AAD7R5R0_9TELE|nr:hypothetical protein AAFF_G00353290 [Aldrovandia affinis]
MYLERLDLDNIIQVKKAEVTNRQENRTKPTQRGPAPSRPDIGELGVTATAGHHGFTALVTGVHGDLFHGVRIPERDGDLNPSVNLPSP